MYKLNNEQNEAVKTLGVPLLVVAGAGSGKTRVITHKISYLINDCKIKPNKIVAVTFTNKAAREMSQRISKTIGKEKSNGLICSTFHTFGLRFIKQEHQALGFNKNISIFDTQDSLKLISELTVSCQMNNKDLERHLNCISNWKGDKILPNNAISIAKDEFELTTAILYEKYQQHLKSYNAVDFDDLILLPLCLLNENLEIREKWQNNIQYLLVDEYQDTNTTQYELIKLLAGVKGSFTVVGDDHQSVYSWRGAKPENMAKLANDFPNLKTIKLEQNYRSTSSILKTANKLINHNNNIFDKNLWSANGVGTQIKIITLKNEEEEANYVASDILTHKFKDKSNFKDYAILYRSNHQARIFEKALREHHVPYILSGATSIFKKTEIKDIMAYLKILINQDDDIAFLRIINTPKRGLGPQTIEKLASYAKNRNISLFDACFEMGLNQFLNENQLEKIRNFANFINLYSDNAKRGDAIEVLREFIKKINYETWLYDIATNPNDAQKRIDNLNDFINWFEKMYRKNEVENFEETVNNMMLIDMLDSSDNDKETNATNLMTMHAAKGLEFKNVYVIGMNDGVLPHQTSIDEDNIQEERRLAYVALTRAMKNLTITLIKTQKKYREIVDLSPSRFINELSTEDCVFEGIGAKVDPEKLQEKGKSHLAQMRSMLKN